MKFKIEIDLEDFLEEEISKWESDSGQTLYRLKEDSEIFEEIKSQIIEQLVSDIRYSIRNSSLFTDKIKEFTEIYKDEIIEAIVQKVSKSLINNKLLKDFKKTLDE